MSEWVVHHGDCLDVLRTLPDASVDAVVTDPPFKLSQEYSANADPDNLIAVASFLTVAKDLYRVATDGALAVVFYDNRILPLGLKAMSDAGWKYLRCLTLYRRWGNAHKMGGWMSTSDIALVCAKPGAPYTFNGPWRHDVFVKASPEAEAFGHPAQKPIAFLADIVPNVCPTGGTVLDCYTGSGTTGVACVQTGRKFIGIEIDAGYCDIARRRIAEAVPLFAGSAA